MSRATETARLFHENRRLRAELHLSRHMVFASPAMHRIADMVERVGPKDVTVLILGQSGTGKELVAKALVAASSRKNRPFVKFNCAALSREVAEDELFGHEKGAFTGAIGERAGMFGQANGGTLFLDEDRGARSLGAGQAAPRACRRARCAASARTPRSASTSGSSPPPTATSRPR